MKHKATGMSAAAAIVTLVLQSATAAVVTFETVPLTPAGFWNGSDNSGGITLGGATFNNTYTSLYDSWSGFAVSNHTDTTTPGWGNQYSAYPGSGADASSNYAVGYYATYEPSTNIAFASLVDLAGQGASFTNTTWAALSMRDGDGFAKQFGGASGDDADWLLLTIEGFAAGSSTGTVDFYLADFRFADNSSDYIVDDWRHVDFSTLGSVDELRFTMSSSDNGMYGMNTPSYFAMDNFSVVPEPSSLLVALSGLGLLARRKR